MTPFNKIANVTSTELVKIVADCGCEVMIQFENGKLQSIYKSQLK